MNNTLSVSELTHLIKRDLEENFSSLVIEGELTGFKRHSSGHWYFSLKDSQAVICCTMWKGINNYVFFTPQDGMQVVVTGRITVYPPRGSYQLEVRSMKPKGEGELQAAFERLKQKLFREGLFDEERKRPIPQFPQKIGIVTAGDSAAMHDMINIANRRYPIVELVLASCRVQGEGAAEQIAESIKLLNKRKDLDFIIVGRGGGSLEDLWAFNEEVVARAIHKSRLPVISAVGHEIDYTIADFVADLRAPTPSAAMELATPSSAEIFAFIREFSLNSTRNVLYIIGEKKRHIENLLNSYGFRASISLINNRAQQLDHTLYRIEQKIEKKYSGAFLRLGMLQQGLKGHNVEKILKKGFAIVKQGEHCLQNASEFKGEENALLRFIDGEIEVRKV